MVYSFFKDYSLSLDISDFYGCKEQPITEKNVARCFHNRWPALTLRLSRFQPARDAARALNISASVNQSGVHHIGVEPPFAS